MTSTLSKTMWSNSVDHEVAFWDKTIKQNVGAFRWRYRRTTPGNDLLPGLVDLVSGPRASILDVGCGPAPVVLGKYGKPVDISACDPLAYRYNELLAQNGIKPPVRLTTCAGEELVGTFGVNSFDIVHIRNALDHAYQPVDVVRNMVRCAKPGGVVVIKTLIETGKHQHYHGLHQWDILPGSSDFYIRGRDGETVGVRSVLGDEISLLLSGVHVSVVGSNIRDWLDIVIVKQGATTELLADIEQHFFRTVVQVGHQLADQAVGPGDRKRLTKLIAELTDREAALRASTSYRVGRALAEARSPVKLFTLPIRLLSLVRSSRRST